MPDRELIYIHPNDLKTVWEQVRNGLCAIQTKAHEDWLPEDVYASLKANTSTLHVSYLGGEYEGFIVLSKVDGYQGPAMHIWCGYSIAHDYSMLEVHTDFIEQCAKNIGAKTITFSSPRKGWERHGLKLGFRPKTMVYEKEIQP